VLGVGAIAVSAVTGDGLKALGEHLQRLAAEAASTTEESRPFVVLRPARPRFVVRREGERFRVIGRGVERWVSETDLEDPDKVERLQRRLVREGVERQLVAAGAGRGDEVVIGDVSFEFIRSRAPMGRREELLRAEAEGWEELNALISRADPEALSAGSERRGLGR
jgi:Obg family GTPase CgtA-like protein